MAWIEITFIVVGMTLLAACSGDPEAALERGAQLERSGATEEALEALLEARVEAPESAELLFAIAGAQAAHGDALARQHDLAGARARFTSARETFGRCASAPDLAGAAAYNAATCLLRLDGVLEREKNYADRVENLKATVAALEAVLKSYPEQTRAKTNLDYARYRLALLLQEPPKPPEKEEEKAPEDEGGPVTGVAGATTQLPGATVEVEAGSMVVLHTRPRGETAP